MRLIIEKLPNSDKFDLVQESNLGEMLSKKDAIKVLEKILEQLKDG